MSYYISKHVQTGFDQTIEAVTQALKTEGFGIITEIDMQATLKKKLNVDFRRYTILGACSPTFAYEALQVEDKIGVLLPCNVFVQETGDGQVEVAAMDPVEAMATIDNPKVAGFAAEIREKLQRALDSL